MIWWALAALGVAVIAAPFILELLRPSVTRARPDAPGQVADLPRGATHYQWSGPQDGPIVVCIHGLTTPSFVWGPIARGLAKQGFRVLTYDLYGRGHSARPRGTQDAAFFVSQLEDLLDALAVDRPVTLLGYSMGGAIATAFAAKHAQRIRQLVLLAPAGMGHDLGPVARLVVNHNRLGQWLFMAFYARSYRAALETERGMSSSIPDAVDLQLAELDIRGFRPAVLSSLRNMLEEDMQPAHRAVAAVGLPVLAIWARADGVIPISGLGKLAESNRAARQEVIENAGHALAYTHDSELLSVLEAQLVR